MRAILALMRAAWLSATSYRVATLLSLAGLLASILPIYFIADAVQEIAQEAIRPESDRYFAFVVVGIAATYIIASAVSAVPSAIAGSIGSGTFEALLVTRTRLPVLLLGMSGYPVVQSLVRAALLVAAAAVIGTQLRWTMLPFALAVVALLIAAYMAIGLVAAALVLVFRTTGPLITAVIAGSGLLGGVYYPTAVIPGWLQSLADFVPLTYGLRAVRMLLLSDAPAAEVMSDVATLALIATTGLALGTLAFGVALKRARTVGTLSQY